MKKHLFPLAILSCLTTLTYADNDANNFAIQAGSVAGAAQACGQDISEFSNRVNQTLAILANTTADITQAQQTYQSYIVSTAQKQAQGSQMSCVQVIKDYNSLPLMQSDYQETVLGKIRKTLDKPVTFLPTQEPVPTPTHQNTGDSPGGVPNSVTFPNPNTTTSPAGVPNAVTFGTSTPTQQQVTPPTGSAYLPPPAQFNDSNSNTPPNTMPPGIAYGSSNAIPPNQVPNPANASLPNIPSSLMNTPSSATSTSAPPQ